MASNYDLILISQSNIVDYEGYGDLPLDRLDIYASLVYPRMVHYKGRFRSHLDYLNLNKFGATYKESSYDKRRNMYNIWNLPAMGGIHIANYLSQFGINVRIINNLDSEWDWFEEVYRSCSVPPLVGISSTFNLSWKEIGNISKRLRSVDPDMALVLGGAFVNAETIHGTPLNFEEKMRKHCIRYVLHAFNSERDLRDLINALKNNTDVGDVPNCCVIDDSFKTGTFKASTKTWHSPLLSLSDVPATWDRLELPFLNRTIQIRTASGCPFDCSFCSYPSTAGGWETVNIETVRAHLDSIMRIKGVDRIIFIDDTFNVPVRRFNELLKLFAEYQFEWFSFLRVQYVTDDVVKMMKDSGCKGVYLGVESANDQILQNMNKKVTASQFANGVNLLNKYDINYIAAFVLGFPGENSKSIQDNVDFIRNNGVRFYSLKEFYYMEHTSIHSQREKYGLSGIGNKWSHSTMDSDQATNIKIDIFKSIKESTHIDADTSLWYLAYLYDQGYNFGQIKSIQEEINDLMKYQLRSIGDNTTWQ